MFNLKNDIVMAANKQQQTAKEPVAMKVQSAVNWNTKSGITEALWNQQIKQFWVAEEVATSKDLLQWKKFEHKSTYVKVLGGLTLLDTIQTNVGMNEIARFTNDNQKQAVMALFGAFEAIHAKSYSYIFNTICTNAEIDEVHEWITTNKNLQYKANTIRNLYEGIKEGDNVSLWKAMFASVMLESFLFYSGFFYPLYLGGNGIMKNSAEIISLILRDESIHGVGIGVFAQEIFAEFDENTQNKLHRWGYELLLDLYDNEMEYTEELYTNTGLSGEVKAYVRYNANKALMNIGMGTMFPDEEINPIVMNGIRTDTVSHDFFSQKGNGYAIADVKPILDSTFDFTQIDSRQKF